MSAGKSIQNENNSNALNTNTNSLAAFNGR